MNAQQTRPSLRRFTADERERLTRLRRAVQRGERSDTFPVDRRQEFVRWLVAQGRLSEDVSSDLASSALVSSERQRPVE